MKFYYTLNRSVLVAVLFITLTLILIKGEFSDLNSGDKNGLTHKNRMDYISSLGYSICDEAIEEEKIVLPFIFSDFYEKYNDIQLESGYDLRNYCGCTVTKYSYRINTSSIENYRINLLVHKGEIIGGDISAENFGGEILPLKDEKYGKNAIG